MAYDEGLVERMRHMLRDEASVVEKKMFGGLAFMVHGYMCCGVNGEEMMVRVGPERYEEALARPHARVMDFTKKPLRGYVYVGTEGFESDEDLDAWIRMGVAFVSTLPPK